MQCLRRFHRESRGIAMALAMLLPGSALAHLSEGAHAHPHAGVGSPDATTLAALLLGVALLAGVALLVRRHLQRPSR